MENTDIGAIRSPVVAHQVQCDSRHFSSALHRPGLPARGGRGLKILKFARCFAQ